MKQGNKQGADPNNIQEHPASKGSMEKKQGAIVVDLQERAPPPTHESNTICEVNKSMDRTMKNESAQVSNNNQPANMDTTSTDHQQYTDDEKRIYVRYHAVMDVVLAGKMGQVTTMDVKYLVGRDSGYHSLHSSHHTSRTTCTFSSEAASTSTCKSIQMVDGI